MNLSVMILPGLFTVLFTAFTVLGDLEWEAHRSNLLYGCWRAARFCLEWRWNNDNAREISQTHLHDTERFWEDGCSVSEAGQLNHCWTRIWGLDVDVPCVPALPAHITHKHTDEAQHKRSHASTVPSKRTQNSNRPLAPRHFKELQGSAFVRGTQRAAAKWHGGFSGQCGEIAAGWFNWKCHCGAKPQANLPPPAGTWLIRQAPEEAAWLANVNSAYPRTQAAHKRVAQNNWVKLRGRLDSPRAARWPHSHFLLGSLAKNPGWGQDLKTDKTLALFFWWGTVFFCAPFNPLWHDQTNINAKCDSVLTYLVQVHKHGFCYTFAVSG